MKLSHVQFNIGGDQFIYMFLKLTEKVGGVSSMAEFTILLAAYTFIGTVGLLLMRLGLLEIGPLSDKLGAPLALIKSLRNLKLILGFGCYAVSFILFTFILSRQTITYVLPLATGLWYIASVFGAYLLLGERVASLQLVGIVLVGLGIVLILRN